jgi:hypothetical protein
MPLVTRVGPGNTLKGGVGGWGGMSMQRARRTSLVALGEVLVHLTRAEDDSSVRPFLLERIALFKNI